MRNLKRGATLYILLYHRSKSGLSRFYRVFSDRIIEALEHCAHNLIYW